MEKFVPSSMDKVLFGGGIRVDGLKRIISGWNESPGG
jgi:hypothetical protein